MCIRVYLSIYAPGVCSTFGSRNKAVDALELKLLVVSGLAWVLETGHTSSARAASAAGLVPSLRRPSVVSWSLFSRNSYLHVPAVLCPSASLSAEALNGLFVILRVTRGFCVPMAPAAKCSTMEHPSPSHLSASATS